MQRQESACGAVNRQHNGIHEVETLLHLRERQGQVMMQNESSLHDISSEDYANVFSDAHKLWLFKQSFLQYLMTPFS